MSREPQNVHPSTFPCTETLLEEEGKDGIQTQEELGAPQETRGPMSVLGAEPHHTQEGRSQGPRGEVVLPHKPQAAIW